ncbi:hypothetical protein NG895_25760 [Aeoliella sp. ICT_H6.2]|uniref:Uncharacterized protein n=1 Tax=Aeoliella straminimaris TaxID=2954799 RepID=A0A9X2JJ81_9BACT|nr:hypothetical protein [Aeoliella straminimaris]MCO6047322.1 hypothetical protein [Aeoliella straminimaris]
MRNALRYALSATAIVLLLSHPSASGADFIWIEGEDATRQQATQHGWYDSVKKETLSGGEWLSHFDEGREGTAEFDFQVDQAGEYTFWLRANPVQAKLSCRLDDESAWQQVDFGGDLRGQINIASDDKPDLRFIAWVKVGKFDLTAGQHKLAFRMHSGPQHHGGIDCLVLARGAFVPSGTTKPADNSQPAKPDEWFPVIMDIDPLSPQSVIDISHLVEAPAGQHGFLKRQGDTLRFENASQSTKFWGVGSPPQGHTPGEMQLAARWFRKHGINMVRQHTMIGAVGLLNEQGQFDRQRLEQYDRWFAALKEQGIYSTWSVVYPHHGAFLRPQDLDADLFAELDAEDSARNGRQRPIVANDYINLDRRIQDAAWRYFDALLNHVNPHTGLAYKDDPALAVLEVQNESNVFFFTLNTLLDNSKVPQLSQDMRRRFYEFAEAKYGTQQAAERAWGRSMPGDRWKQGELALMGAHHWGADGPLYEYKGQDRRCGDYIEFLTSVQREYFERRIQQMRDAGFQGVAVTTAWKSGGPAASLANLYCDTAGDSIDRHNYFGGGDGGHRIVEGQVNTDTHLDQPGRGLLAVGMFQVDDRPFSYSEWSQMPPNPWKAEAAPLIAFYGMGLQGWDASYHFNMGDRRIGDGWPGQSKYTTHTPHYMAQFPALAFAVHNGHLDEGETIAMRSVALDELYTGRDLLGQSLSGGGHDTKQLLGRGSTPPEALAAGRVTIAFVDKSIPIGPVNISQRKSRTGEFHLFHDAEAKTIRSTTGQLLWRYGDRIVEVRSPKTQGVIGFAQDKTIRLPDVAVRTSTPFVSLLFTPLDNQPLRQSKRILITAMARDKQTGSEFNEDWSQLLVEGRPPLLMEPVQSLVRLDGEAPKSVTPLDLYGVPMDQSVTVSTNGTFQIDGTHRTYYYEVVR